MPQRRPTFSERIGRGLLGAAPGLNQIARDRTFLDRSQQQQDAIAGRTKDAALQRVQVDLQGQVAAGTLSSQQAESIWNTVRAGQLPDFDSLVPQGGGGLGLDEALQISRLDTPQLGSGLAITSGPVQETFAGAIESRTEDRGGFPSGIMAERVGGDLTGKSFFTSGATEPIGAPALPQEFQDRDRAGELQRTQETAFAGQLGSGSAQLITEKQRRDAQPGAPPAALSILNTALSEAFGSQVKKADIAQIFAALKQGEFFVPEGVDDKTYDQKVFQAFTSANERLGASNFEFRFDTSALSGRPADPGGVDPTGAAPALEAVKTLVQETGSLPEPGTPERALWDDLTSAQKFEILGIG